MRKKQKSRGKEVVYEGLKFLTLVRFSKKSSLNNLKFSSNLVETREDNLSLFYMS